MRVLSRRGIVVAVAVAVLVLAAVGTGIYLLTKGEDAPGASGGPGAPGPGPTSGAPVAGGPTSAREPATPEPGGPAPADGGDVKAIAEQAVRAINAHDAEALKRLSCDPGAIGPAENTPPEARVELASNPELTGDTATVELKLTIGEASTSTLLPLRKNNGVWCVD